MNFTALSYCMASCLWHDVLHCEFGAKLLWWIPQGRLQTDYTLWHDVSHNEFRAKVIVLDSTATIAHSRRDRWRLLWANWVRRTTCETSRLTAAYGGEDSDGPTRHHLQGGPAQPSCISYTCQTGGCTHERDRPPHRRAQRRHSSRLCTDQSDYCSHSDTQ